MAEKSSSSGSKTLGTLTVIFGLAGYFVYDGFGGMLGIFLISILLGITILLGIIPVIGNVVQYLVMKYILAKIFILTGLWATTLTSMIFWVNMVFGMILSILVIILIISVIVNYHN